MREGGGNCLKYLKWGWNRKEGKGNKDFKKRRQAGSRGRCLKLGVAGNLLTNYVSLMKLFITCLLTVTLKSFVKRLWIFRALGHNQSKLTLWPFDRWFWHSFVSARYSSKYSRTFEYLFSFLVLFRNQWLINFITLISNLISTS